VTWKRCVALLRVLPLTIQATLGLGLLLMAWAGMNWSYQVVRKPSELFFPVAGTLHKTPEQTWRAYGPAFRAHSTAVMTPPLLAALAQIEGSGNPVARTYWRWSFSAHPLEIYRPASSAVGMYQITDGTFDEARRYCVRDHVVIEDGPWNDARSCWFNALYTRVIPGHAIELTSAYLDRRIASVLARNGLKQVSQAKKHELAALIHLCGAGAGNAFARRGLRLTPGQRCGDHDVRVYLDKVARMQAVFMRLGSA